MPYGIDPLGCFERIGHVYMPKPTENVITDETRITARLIDLICDMSIPQQLELLEKLDQNTYKGGRKESRHNRKILVAYEIDDYLHKDITRDISNTGVFIETQSPPAVGENITLSFSFSENKKPVKVSGTVVRSTPEGFAVKFRRRKKK
jgi:hypothetical protein